MSASPNNPGPVTPQPGSQGSSSPTPAFLRPEHRDLETLLALSSLHEQIRRRRAQELNKGARLSPEDAWELKQLVHDEVLQLIADRALTVTGADGVAVALVDGGGIVCRASAGEIAPERGTRLDPCSGFSGACLRTGEIVRCDDSEKDSRVSSHACQRLGTRSMVAVPLSTPKAIVGVLEAFSTEAFGFNDSDVRSLMILGELILDAMKPEDEDLLAEISRRVVGKDANTSHTSQPQIETPNPSNHAEDFAKAQGFSTGKENAAARRASENPKPDTKLVFFSDIEQLDSARPGLKLVVLLVLLAIVLGAALWWQIRYNSDRGTSRKADIQTKAAPVDPAQTGAASPGAQTSVVTDSAPAPEKSSRPQVTGIRHWSSADSSTVVIDLEDQVQYEAHRLTAPERIYFDLLDTTLAHGLSGNIIEVNDGLLQRIRIAQPKQGVTRVVLDTKGASNYAVSLETNPYRLVVEIGKLGSKLGPKAKVELFGPDDHVDADSQIAASKPVLPTQVPIAALAQIPRQVKTGGSVAQLNQLPSLSIVLDAGHGGWDLGTVGRKGLQEKDLVLDIVQRLGGLLRRRLNANVIYTRQDDSYVPLEKRAEIANLSQAQLFVSVHANYSDYASARGVETYYSNSYSSVKARPEGDDSGILLQTINWTKVDIREKVHESHRFADCVQESLYGTIAARNPGIRDRGVKEAQYVVLTGTSMPAILAEVSFVSSPTDENELQNTAYRQRIAEALYKGIARYHETTRHATMASLGKSEVR